MDKYLTKTKGNKVLTPFDNCKQMLITDANTDKIFMWEELEKRVLGDKEIARNIVREFLKDMAGQLNELYSSISKKDVESVRKQVHKIKGAVGNVGAGVMSELMIEIEKYLSNGKDASNLDRYEKLIKEQFILVREQMEEYLTETNVT